MHRRYAKRHIKWQEENDERHTGAILFRNSGGAIESPVQRHATELGERLRKLRDERGMTQVELAHRSGVDQSTISKLESGQRGARPSLTTIRAIERALGKSLDYRSDEPYTPSFIAFSKTDLFLRMKLGDDEIEEFAHSSWWGAGRDPTPEDWYDFLRMIRGMRSRGDE